MYLILLSHFRNLTKNKNLSLRFTCFNKKCHVIFFTKDVVFFFCERECSIDM